MYLQQSQGMGLQSYFNQMQIAEGSYPTRSPALEQAAPQSSLQAPPMSSAPQPQQQGSSQASPPFSHPHSFSPLMEPSEGLLYDPYMSHHHHHHYPQQLPPGPHLHHLHSPHPPEASASSLAFSYAACEQKVLGHSAEAFLQEQYKFPLDPTLMPPPAPGEADGRALSVVLAAQGPPGDLGLPALQSSLLDSEMMETVDSQHGFVLVN